MQRDIRIEKILLDFEDELGLRGKIGVGDLETLGHVLQLSD
jgi:hypothetical protein